MKVQKGLLILSIDNCATYYKALGYEFRCQESFDAGTLGTITLNGFMKDFQDRGEGLVSLVIAFFLSKHPAYPHSAEDQYETLQQILFSELPNTSRRIPRIFFSKLWVCYSSFKIL